MSFDYNSSGLRTKKTVNGEEKQYFYSGDLLISEYNGLEYMNFTYGPDGEPVGFSFFDAEENETLGYFFYFKNLQGDILGLLDHQGAIYCTYSYDAWGKLLGAYDRNGNEITNPNHAAYRNPLRYRGYYYDDETGLYYLNSRYYNPEWGTFICADDANYIGADGTILSYNLYSYCSNNPIIREDSSGYVWETAFDVVSLAASAVEVTMNPTDLTAWIGLVGDTVDLIPFVTGVGETIKVLRTSSKLVDKIDGTVDTYKNLRRINKGSGNEVHHIIEKRLKDSLKIDNTDDMLSIAIDKKTHQAYTSAWRKQLPYKGIYDVQDILKAAATVYSNSAKLFGVVLYSLL